VLEAARGEKALVGQNARVKSLKRHRFYLRVLPINRRWTSFWAETCRLCDQSPPGPLAV